PLPGGDFPVSGVRTLTAKLQAQYGFLDDKWAARLIRAYGTDAFGMLGTATDAADLGEDFGHTITARELDWAAQKEWVRTSDDYLWRRTKLGLRTSADEAARIGAYLEKTAQPASAAE
ncbi:MAG: glycerol-3-phosphate dehydrogenase C-terminal domain-containing protein, partial [Pseudomonadota bacterium]